MSAQPESLGHQEPIGHSESAIHRSSEAETEAPPLEYSQARQDSLTMFGAAIGGAVLGMLLTLLVLAIINGGTLRLNQSPRMDNFAAAFEALSTNVETNSANAQILADRTAADLELLAGAVVGQNDDIAQINETLETLDISRQQFAVFVNAMAEAMRAIEEIEETEETAPSE